MKSKRKLIRIWLLGAVLLALPVVVQAQYQYTTTNGTITITKYIGSGGSLAIPGTINNLPVTSIAASAFYLTPVTSVTIPNSVTNIGAYAFEECNIMTSVTIGNGVTSIGQFAFSTCVDLTAVYFYGSAPTEGAGAFINDHNVTFYYLAGFSTQPTSETVVLGGGSATFSAAISGTPTYQPTYQCQISTNGGATWTNLTDGSGITGSTTETLTINKTTISLSGNQFRVVTTNSAGTFTSSASTLSVLTPVQLSYNFQNLRDPAAAGATIPTGISGGNVVGNYEDSNSIAHGFLYNIVTQTYTTFDGFVTGTATYQGITAKAISGDNIVGGYLDGSSIPHGFLYNIATQNYTTLDAPFAVGSQGGTTATGIDGGNIVGYYFDGYLAWGFLYNIATQTYTTLDDPYAGRGSEFGGIDMGTYATGISGGNIVGWYAADNGIDGGFLYNITTQTYTNTYIPDAWYGSEYGGGSTGINGNTVIGVYYAQNGAQLGFIYNFAAQTYETLDVPVAGNGPNAVTFPTGIDGGNIVGYYDAGNGYVGFLATSMGLSYAVLTVSTNGVGSLSPNYNGASLQVGDGYAITATAMPLRRRRERDLCSPTGRGERTCR